MRSGVDHTVLPASYTSHLPLPRSSPDGATTEWTVIAPAYEAYYSFIDPVRMKAELALLADVQRTPDGLPISCRSGADQWKFAGLMCWIHEAYNLKARMFWAGGGKCWWTTMDHADCLWESSRSSDQLQRRRGAGTWTCCSVERRLNDVCGL